MSGVPTIDVCVDCLFVIANNDWPEDEARRAEVAEGIARWSEEGWELVCGDAENDHDFLWARCECCGSTLGGSRHEIGTLSVTS